MAEQPELVSLAVVIGQNCRRIREEAKPKVTRNELAKYARGVGLRWDTSKVRDFENARSSKLVDLNTVLAASLALSHATGRGVTLADLLTTPNGVAVRLNDRLAPPGAKVVAAFCGEPLQDDHFSSLLAEVYTQLERGRTANSVAEVKQRSGLDEERVAKRLGISDDRLAAESLRLWSRAFSDERDRRAGPEASPQKRGRVSRELQTELQKVLGYGDA